MVREPKRQNCKYFTISPKPEDSNLDAKSFVIQYKQYEKGESLRLITGSGSHRERNVVQQAS